MPLAHEASAAGAAAARPASLPYLTDTATGPTQRMCRFNTEIDSYGNIVISLVLADNPRDEIGHATGSILSGKAGLLEHLEVDPRHRGHRLGDILCNKMCQELYNLGCTAVELIAHPLEENPTGRTKEAFLQESLIPLYTRCGFVIAGEYPVASDRSFMVRNLSTAPVVPVPELFPYPPGKPPAAGAGPAAPIPVAAAVAAGAIL
jgi:GNAT superfamily N-acetyltransferase